MSDIRPSRATVRHGRTQSVRHRRCRRCRPGTRCAAQLPRSPRNCERTGTASGIAAATSAREILAAHFVRKSYRKGPIAIPVLQGVDLAIGEGEFVAIVGPSGCGKSTLLHLLATLDAPDVGRDLLRRQSHRQPAVGRARHPAQPLLRHDLSVLSPAAGAHDARKRAGAGDDRRGRARLLAAAAAISRAGTRDARAGRPRPSAEAQAARTVRRRDAADGDRPGAGRPAAACCWPTSRPATSTSATGEEIMAILRRLNREQNLTIVMVTHDRRSPTRPTASSRSSTAASWRREPRSIPCALAADVDYAAGIIDTNARKARCSNCILTRTSQIRRIHA